MIYKAKCFGTTFWNYFGTTLELLWNYFGTTLELLWNYFGTTLEPLWPHFFLGRVFSEVKVRKQKFPIEGCQAKDPIKQKPS